MTDRNNILPDTAEEFIIESKSEKQTQTDLKVSDILKTKTLIPSDFVKLEVQEGNYCGSTNTKWNKPLCERYGFAYKGEWIQIDIPHDLMEILGIEKGEDISRLFYLNSSVLSKGTSYGGITIENEKEVFLLEPSTGEKETQTELSGKDISELKKKNEEQAKRIQELEIINEELKKQVSQLQEKKTDDLDKSEQKSSEKKYRGTCGKCHCREIGSYPASSMGWCEICFTDSL